MATRYPPADTDARGAAYELLANRRRRHVLSYLRDHPHEEIPIDDLTSQVIARELMAGEGPVDPESVSATLHHVHLPKLDDAGIVDYDEDAHVVYTPPADGEVTAGGDPGAFFEGRSA